MTLLEYLIWCRNKNEISQEDMVKRIYKGTLNDIIQFEAGNIKSEALFYNYMLNFGIDLSENNKAKEENLCTIDSKRLKERRIEKGISGAELSRLIHRQKRYISRIECGILEKVTLENIEQLADILEMHPTALLKNTDMPVIVLYTNVDLNGFYKQDKE